MRVIWTSKASSDLARLHQFLAEVNPRAAVAVVRKLIAAPHGLASAPHRGERLAAYAPREIRRILAGDDEVRYEIVDQTIHVLRIWHTREDR